jgi:predicted AlkP superfamily phosphohydrolase/phosphomutase
LFVGLDSVEPALTARWLADGRLPTLAALARRSTVRDVRNYPGLGNGVWWPSVSTTVEPARHGRFFIRQLVPGSYRFAEFTASDFRAPPFWQALEQEGGRVAVIDAVRSPFARLERGLEVRNWRTHDPDGPLETSPPALATTLAARFGVDPLAPGSDAFLKRTRDVGALLGHARARIEDKTRWCRELLAQDWDFFSVTFHEPHDLGHLCWHLHDSAHRAHDPALVARLGDPLLEVYRACDSALAELVRAAGPDATVVVMTGPGIEANATGNPLLETLLARLERPRPPGDAAPGGPARPSLARALRARLPAPVARLARRAREALYGTDAERARAAARWFALPHNDNAGAVRVNLAGRDPQGRVAPGRRDAVLDELCALLDEVRDVAGGRPVVREYVRPDPALVRAPGLPWPDLLVVWNRDADFRAIESPRLGRLDWPNTPLRTGDHSERGQMFVATDRRLPAVLAPATLAPHDAGAAVEELARAGRIPQRRAS